MTRALILALVLFSAAIGVAAENLDAIERGKRIFHQGVGMDGEIEASMNDGQLVLTAAMLPCGGCHRLDGRGGAEGGVTVPDVRWSALARPLSISGATERTRPAYDALSLKRAITMGFDAGDNELHRAMPRYRLSKQDADDLLAFLRSLDQEEPDGVRGDTLVVGTLLPAGDTVPYAELLRERIEQLNEEGGIYGRKIKLVTAQSGGTREDAAERLRELVEEEKPLALLAPFFAGDEETLASITEEAGVPVVAPLAYAPVDARDAYHGAFWLLPGQHHAIELLVAEAAEGASRRGSPVALLLPDQPRARRDMLPDDQIEELVRGLLAKRGIYLHVIRFASGAHDASAVVAAVPESGIREALVLGDRLEAEALIQEFRNLEQDLDVFLLSSATAPRLLASAERFEDYAGSIYMALPSLVAGVSGAGRGGMMQQTADLGFAVLVEALKRSGERVHREALIESLESLNGFETGTFPPVRFGPGRRSGVRGALVFHLGNRESSEPPVHWASLDDAN